MSAQRRRKTKLGPLYRRRIRVTGLGPSPAYWYCFADGTPVVCADKLFYVMELEPDERPNELTLYADTQRPRGSAFVTVTVGPLGHFQWTDGIRTSEWFSPSPALRLAIHDITRYGFTEFFKWVIINDADW